jgi:hypothetical protein
VIHVQKKTKGLLLVFMCMFYRSCLSFFFWPSVLSVLLRYTDSDYRFGLSSNSSVNSDHILSSTKGSNKCPQFRNFVYKLITLYSCLLHLSKKRLTYDVCLKCEFPRSCLRRSDYSSMHCPY